MPRPPRIVFFYNTDRYLYHFRLPMARRLRDLGIDVLMISPGGPYGLRLREAGFTWLELPMKRRSLNPVREIRLLIQLVRIFRRERPDLVHGFTIKCAVYGTLAGRLAGVPGQVASIAGLGYVFTSDHAVTRIIRSTVRGLLRLTLRGPRTRVIVQNPDDQLLLGQIASPQNLRLIPGSGVDCLKFRPVPKRNDCSRPLRVLLPARLLWEKGIAEYVDAARQTRSEGREIQFLLAGEPDSGNPSSVPESQIQKWTQSGLIDWLGDVDNMPALLQSVDVLVLPSYREGLSRSLIEGAACGLGLVTTDAPGCRDVVTHEINGLLVPPRDAPALAAAIARLDDDRSLLQRLGERARVSAVERFSEGLVFEHTLSVYSELVPAIVQLGERESDHEAVR